MGNQRKNRKFYQFFEISKFGSSYVEIFPNLVETYSLMKAVHLNK